MTEYWKSNPMYWCDYCKVWMNDNPNARAVHERGIKHKENVEKKLRDMRKKAERDKQEAAFAEATMASIEAKARKEFEKDMKAAAKDAEERIGTWEKQEATGYYYNSAHRYYFDPGTKMYYGGDPAAWTVQPSLPKDALFDAASLSQKAPPRKSAEAGEAKAQSAFVRRVSEAEHPSAGIGGHRIPSAGEVGGKKRVGYLEGEAVQGSKRARQASSLTPSAPGKGEGGLSKEEEEARQKREAAKQRVQQRTLAGFGFS